MNPPTPEQRAIRWFIAHSRGEMFPVVDTLAEVIRETEDAAYERGLKTGSEDIE